MSKSEETHQSDRVLMGNFASGQKEAAEEIVSRLMPVVSRMVYRLSGWNEDIQDIVQDTFLSIQSSAKSFRGESQLETWAISIVVRCCRKHHRVEARQQICQEQITLAPDDSFARQQTTLERREEVRFAMAKLSRDEAELLVLRYMEDWSLDSLAQLYAIRKNTLEVRLNRARKRLGEILAQQTSIETL